MNICTVGKFYVFTLLQAILFGTQHKMNDLVAPSTTLEDLPLIISKPIHICPPHLASTGKKRQNIRPLVFN
jgi:hypothetical protein